MLWVYRVADNVFVRDRGTEPLAAGEAEIDLSDNPRPEERFDATSLTKRRPATALEIAAAADAQKDGEIDNLKALQAMVRATHELKTNAWTLAQYAARVKQIYRGL